MRICCIHGHRYYRDPRYRTYYEEERLIEQIRDNKWTFKDNYKQIQEFINKEQSKNAILPIVVTESGIITLVIGTEL